MAGEAKAAEGVDKWGGVDKSPVEGGTGLFLSGGYGMMSGSR